MFSKKVLKSVFLVVVISFIFIIGYNSEVNKTQTEKTEQFEQHMDCAYMNMQADSSFSKMDIKNNVFMALLRNVGASNVSITFVELWVGDNLENTIFLNATISEQEKSLALYLNLDDYFSSNGKMFTKIKIGTPCDSVYSLIFMPSPSWKEFNWSNQAFAN